MELRTKEVPFSDLRELAEAEHQARVQRNKAAKLTRLRRQMGLDR